MICSFMVNQRAGRQRETPSKNKKFKFITYTNKAKTKTLMGAAKRTKCSKIEKHRGVF